MLHTLLMQSLNKLHAFAAEQPRKTDQDLRTLTLSLLYTLRHMLIQR